MNRSRLALVAVATMLVLAVAGCTPTPPLELTQADNGSTQQLEGYQELNITLESNPTTGYKWEREGEMPEPLVGGDSEYIADSDAIGGGGKETFHFKADSAGEGTLKLKYWRSFEPTVPPIETFEVTVKVNVD